jgi:hypothetical protein
VFEDQTEKTKCMWKTYHSATFGIATPEEINSANETLKDLCKAAGFTTLLLLPGTLLFLPFIIKAAKDNGIDIVPDSVKKQFNLKE